jgi:hypothetical protein
LFNLLDRLVANILLTGGGVGVVGFGELVEDGLNFLGGLDKIGGVVDLSANFIGKQP